MQWRLVLSLGCVLVSVSSQSKPQKRRCAFQVAPQNDKYTAAGNVSGLVQECENTDCCVAYFWIVDGEAKVDALACDLVEKSCPDATCRAQKRFDNFGKCACNTDLCNSNISWSSAGDEPTHTSSVASSPDGLTRTALKLLVLLLAMSMLFAAKWRGAFQETKEDPQSSGPDYSAPPWCHGHSAQSSVIHRADLELQQIVGQGRFATVFKGRYKESTVAVKFFPAAWKHRFAAEKEVHQLPLMRHAGIVPFLGAGRTPNDGSCFIVLHFAEHGSLHSFLCRHTSSWTSCLRLSQSLSQGLSFLHSALPYHNEHKPAVSHGDLSSSNVLVRADMTCMLCDFGASTVLRPRLGSRSPHGPIPVTAAGVEGHMGQGALRYMSPEVLEGSVNLGHACFLLQGDVYALALLLWEIWMRCSDLFPGGAVPQHRLPYELELGTSVTLESLVQHVFYMDKRPSVPQDWELLPQGPALTELLTDCWDAEPDARLSAQRVMERLTSLQSFSS